MSDKEHIQAVTERLSRAGISDAHISLALETSQNLHELLARYKLAGHRTPNIRDIFSRLAARQDEAS